MRERKLMKLQKNYVSNSKIKVSLHRIRKKIKISLNKGGYNYGE